VNPSMKKNSPLILITNDDGVRSPGILALAEAVIDLAEIVIVAPIEQQTGMGRSFPRGSSGIIEKIKLELNGKSLVAYGVHGSPAQAVSHGVLEICCRKPDYCLSGINYGENLGGCLTCSGTLGAAFEADSHGIPTMAISRQAALGEQHGTFYASMDWEEPKRIARLLMRQVLKKGFPHGASILNVNIPNGTTIETPIRWTCQSRLNYFEFKRPPERNYSEPYRLESVFQADHEKIEKNSDVHAFHLDRVISITPLTWDMSVKVDSRWEEHFQ